MSSTFRPLLFRYLTKLDFNSGIICHGTVEQMERNGEPHYGINWLSDWWYHPALLAFLGRRIGVSLNLVERQMEVTDWPDFGQTLAVLHDDGWQY